MILIRNLLLYLLIVIASLFLQVMDIVIYVKIMLMLLSVLAGICLYTVNRSLFAPALFFLVNMFLCPVSLYLMNSFEIHIPQLYLMPSIIVYMLIVICNDTFRKELYWMNTGVFDRVTVILIIIMTVVSSAALFIWAYFFCEDIAAFKKFIPDVTLPMLLVYGLAFPVFNALFEEFLARAVLYDGFAAVFEKVSFVIFSQAIVFALWHYNGFPGGVIGVIMVFAWSLFLGIIRYRSGGMLPPLVAHFFADLAIALIIFMLVISPA